VQLDQDLAIKSHREQIAASRDLQVELLVATQHARQGDTLQILVVGGQIWTVLVPPMKNERVPVDSHPVVGKPVDGLITHEEGPRILR
jgi:hypothetical protein